MPIYEYKCRDCGCRFEALTAISREKDVTCPGCRSAQIEKCASAFGIGGSSRRTKASHSSCAACTSHSCSSCT